MSVTDVALLVIILGYSAYILFGKKKRGCSGGCSGCQGCSGKCH